MKCIKDFLQFYEPVGPELQCYSVLWTGDPTGGNLNLRESGEHTHFHSYKHFKDAGHYHFDVTPEEINYIGYFNIPKEVYTDASSNNNINSFPFYWTYDGTAPVYLSGTYITGNNSKVKIRLSETVYDTDSGSGALEVGDFTLSISGGSATLGSVNPTAITKDTPTFSSTTLDNNLGGAFGLELVDLDFDGDMDIVATGIDWDDINWYENDGSENFTETLIEW